MAAILVAAPLLLALAVWPISASAECTAPTGREAVRLAHRSAVFAGPGPTHRVVGEVPGGACLRVEGRQADWYRVRIPGGDEAWLHQAAVAEVVTGPRRSSGRTTPRTQPQQRPQTRTPAQPPPPQDERPPRDETPQGTDAAAQVSPPATDESAGPWAGATVGQAASGAPEGILELVVAVGGTPPEVDVGVVLKSQTLLRASPADDGRIIRVLQPETRLDLVALDRSGDWLQVRREGDAEGWLPRSAVRELPPAWRPEEEEGSTTIPVPRPTPAPPAERAFVGLGAGYVAVWQQVQTDVDAPRLNYAIRGLAVGGRVHGTWWIGERLGLEIRYGVGFLSGIDMDYDGQAIQLSAAAHAGRVGPTLRQPLSAWVDGALGNVTLTGGAGYHASTLMVQRTNPPIFTNHLFHGGYLAAGLDAPLPGTPAVIVLSGGPSLSTTRQWPHTSGSPKAVLGWHVEGGLQLPMWQGSRLDLRYHAQGRDGWFEGEGTWDERIGQGRTQERDHGLTAGVVLVF